MHLHANHICSDNEISLIISQSLNTLEEVGVLIENQYILNNLREYYKDGCSIRNSRIYFNKSMVKDVLSSCRRVETIAKEPRVSSSAEINEGYFLDPFENKYKPWEINDFLDYVRLAKSLDGVDNASMLGVPFKEGSGRLQPLYEKYYCFKYGISGGCAIWETDLCDRIYEIYSIYADDSKQNLSDIFSGTVYMITPFKFCREEAAQFEYFHRKGLRVHVGSLGSIGTSTPVTLAGAICVQTAESIFIHLLNRCFFGDDILHMGNSVSTTDMKTGQFKYGRPEQSMINIAGADIAKFLGATFGGHCGLSDALEPSIEAGTQKVLSAMSCLLSYGSGHMAAGLLGVDTIFSPVQMIFDAEAVLAMRHMCKGIKVDDDTLAFDVIKECSEEGIFLMSEHTVEHMRHELFEPINWSKGHPASWMEKNYKNETDRAKEVFNTAKKRDLQVYITDAAEKDILAVIAHSSENGK